LALHRAIVVPLAPPSAAFTAKISSVESKSVGYVPHTSQRLRIEP
jgi:hypothetical protein